MSTKIFFGEAGTGKTTSMFQKIKELAMKGKECVLFVPEQFSFDTERRAYFSVGAENIRHVSVTGFSKLSRAILKEFRQAKPVADNAVKLVTMWLAVEKLKGNFLYFDKNANSPAFCGVLLKTVAALRNGGISPNELNRFLTSENVLDEELTDKTGDILAVYSEYDRMLTENLDDKLDDVSRAAVLAEKHDYFSGKYLFFDNFDTFSEVQKKMLETSLRQCEESVFCFTSDKPDSGKREFLCVSRTIAQVKAIAPDYEEREFSVPYRAMGRDKPSAELYSAKDTYEEARLIAAKIHHAVRDEGFRYRDFLVLTPDREKEPIISSALRLGGIPVFSDFPRPMTEKPVIGFVLRIFKSLELDTEELLKLTESGFKRIRDFERPERGVRLMFQSEVYRLRLAAEQYGLRTEDWTKDWSEEIEPRKNLNPLENIRRGIVEPLIKLRKELESAENGNEMSKVFMSYLFDSENIRSTFIARSKAGQGGETDTIETDESEAEEYGRIWDALSEALTSVAYGLKNTRIGYKQYGELLEQILSGINLANPPAVLDSVTVGDTERTRKFEPKTVFIAGVNEGAMPRESKLQSAFSYFEREKLSESGLPLYDSGINRWSKEYYFAYRAMNLYGKRLILSYSAQAPDGKELEKAAILKETGLKAIPVDELPDEYFLNTEDDVKRALAASTEPKLSDMLENILNEVRAERAGSEFRAKLADSEALLSGKRRFSLSPKTAEALLNSAEYSPTRLEAAFSCPLMYFFKYGLFIREPESNDPEALNNLGSAVHDILKTALSAHGDITGKTWEEIDLIAEEAIFDSLKRATEKDPTFPQKTEAVYKSLFGRIRGILRQISLDLKVTGFTPVEFERMVSYIINDPEFPEGHITIKGSADRIDAVPKEKENDSAALESYIRICDYKSSEKSFTLDGIAGGKNLQPLLYLFGKCGEEKNLIPGAACYSSIGGLSALKTETSLPPDPDELLNEWYGKHAVHGGSLSQEVAEKTALTKSAAGKRNGTDIPLGDAEQLKKHIDNEIILPKLKEIIKGNIEALPLEHEGALPCPFCGFRSVCGNREFNVVSSEGMWEEKNKR